MEPIKIMLIENQYQQFEDLFFPLQKLGYQVFPNISQDEEQNNLKFREVMDEVRIILSGRYGTAKEEIAKNNLIRYKERTQPDLYIIDHVLVGHDEGKKGFAIAELFRNLDFTPILFLSRTPVNSKEVYDGLNLIVQPRAWLHKGYNGEEILKEDFIEGRLKKEIDQLIAIREQIEFVDIIERVRMSPALNKLLTKCFEVDDIKEVFTPMGTPDKLSADDRNAILDIYRKIKSDAALTRDDVKKFGNQLLKKR